MDPQSKHKQAELSIKISGIFQTQTENTYDFKIWIISGG